MAHQDLTTARTWPSPVKHDWRSLRVLLPSFPSLQEIVHMFFMIASLVFRQVPFDDSACDISVGSI